MSKKWAQPEAQRHARAATARPLDIRDRDDLTPLPQEFERLRGKVSDAKQMFHSQLDPIKSRVTVVEEALKSLAKSHADDKDFRTKMILSFLGLALTVVLASFNSCVQQRESLAELKAEVRSISKGK